MYAYTLMCTIVFNFEHINVLYFFTFLSSSCSLNTK